MSLLGSLLTLGGMILGGVLGSLIPGIGTSVGIAVGSMIGSAIGGYVGSVLFADKVNPNSPPPPRPRENRVQISTYAAPIPIVYESARIAGNVIYMQTPNVSLAVSKHRQDGVRYYEYVQTTTSTFAIAFCEGPVSGISRIWVNSEIFADFRDPAGEYYPTGSVTYAVTNFETSIELEAIYFTIYTGTETQTADPDITAILGAVETPAYRGICYVVFKDFPIGEFSGLPKIEVEIGPQMEAGMCSEYYNGINGTSPETDILERIQNIGNEPEIYDNKLRFTLTLPDFQSLNEYQTVFSFNGEFDCYIDFDLPVLADEEYGYVYISVGSSFPLYFEFTLPERDYYTSAGYYETTDTSGKLRLIRDSLNNVYGFVWNNSLSRWEWDGNESGILMGNIAGATKIIYGVSVADGTVVDIGDFITNSGCDDITT
jgi:hypothetical protein